MDTRSNRVTARSRAALRFGRRYLPLLAMHLLAAVLLTSWLVPPTSQFWKFLDQLVFRSLNGSLVASKTWQWIAALSNCRGFDVLAGGVMVGLLSLHVVQSEHTRRRSGWNGLAILVLGVLVGRWFFMDALVHGAMGYHRPSPSLVIAETLRLTELVPNVPTKDASPWSFPGDHGYVLFCIALFLTFRSSRRLAVTAWCAAAALALPRLISGAHWFSDVAVGSLSLSLITVAWLLSPPLRRWSHLQAEADVDSSPTAAIPATRRAA